MVDVISHRQVGLVPVMAMPLWPGLLMQDEAFLKCPHSNLPLQGAWGHDHSFIRSVVIFTDIQFCVCLYLKQKILYLVCIYSQTSLIRASLIRMPHNPNTILGNLHHFLFTMIQ